MINPFHGVDTIFRLCVAFLKLFEAYASKIRLIQNPSDLVLKIIPMEWISSGSTYSSSSPASYLRLAKEVYDRCPSTQLESSPYASASLFQLADPIPRTIDFRLNADSASSLFQHEHIAHIGYSWVGESAWMTAAITDNLGCHHWVGSFSLRDSLDPWPSFQAIAKEIWEIMLEAMKAAEGNRRVFVAKDRPMLIKEVEGTYSHNCQLLADRIVWASLASGHPGLSLALVVVESRPPVRITNKTSIAEQVEADSMPGPIPTTPDLTSLDPNGPKLLEESDPSAYLIDQAEETWGVISACSLVAQPHGLEVQAAVANGYLVRPSRWIIGVRVVHAEKTGDFRELLKMYHGLIVLAELRGIQERLPWHLAMTSRALEGLRMLN